MHLIFVLFIIYTQYSSDITLLDCITTYQPSINYLLFYFLFASELCSRKVIKILSLKLT